MESMGDQDEADGSLSIKKDEEMNMKLRVCQICEKVFSSGKALGGHMRSHLQITFNKQQNRRQAAAAAGVCGGSGKCRCVICGKNFPSMKSLFGHMRCHPNRDWRGIHPPPPSSTAIANLTTSSSSSSSSSLSDVNKIEDGMRERAVDLTESLRRGWAVTAKRGRKATEAEDGRLRDAVNFLMMLAECKHACGEVVDIYEQRESDESSEMKKVLKKKKKKKTKKVKLCDLNFMENNNDDKYNNNILHNTKGVVLDFDLNQEPPLEIELHHDQHVNCCYTFAS